MIDTSAVSARRRHLQQSEKEIFLFLHIRKLFSLLRNFKAPSGLLFHYFPFCSQTKLSRLPHSALNRDLPMRMQDGGEGVEQIQEFFRPEIRIPPPSCRVRLPRNEDFLREKIEFAPKRVARNNGSRENYELVAG